MVAPVQKDSLTDYQVALATYLRISSPFAGMFTGTEIKPNPNARSIRVPDIRVDDYIVDADIARIGADHYSGSEFTDEWKNGVPPVFWREYSMSRHRAFGFTVFDEQLRYSPIKNIVQEYIGRKMQTTVLRDHDKYCMLAAIQGHMTGKMVPRVGDDLQTNIANATPGGAARIANTGNAADYKWIAEPGEDYDNQIQPSFATVTGMEFDADNPLDTLDALTLMFSDNWFDSNFGNNERFMVITSAMELQFINALIDAGVGTESAFKLTRDGDISGANAAGYLGTLKGSWKLVKMHPEFFPKVYVHDTSLVVNPIADDTTGQHSLRQVVALAAYKNSIQTYEHFNERREQDGGTRFKGTEYVQDFSYDVWAIDQLSEGIVPLFLPAAGDWDYGLVDESFDYVADRVAKARAQAGVMSPDSDYPMNPADTTKSRPEWFHQPYNTTSNIDSTLPITETGDVAHRHPTLESDQTALDQVLNTLGVFGGVVLAGTDERADATAYNEGDLFKVGDSLFQVIAVTGDQESDGSLPAEYVGAEVGDVVEDNNIEAKRIY